TVTELQDVMPMGPPRHREPPKIRFENCFVRGRGDGIWVRVSRQINVEVEKSLFALDGSFLTIEGAKDVRLQSVSTVSLKETTTYLTDHLLLLGPSRDDPKKKALVTTAISAANCLFVPAGKKSLVRLDGFEAKDDRTLQG